MKKIYLPVIVFLCSLPALQGKAQKTVAEGTIIYDMQIETGIGKSEPSQATTTVFLKGVNSRTEMTSGLGNETTIHNGKTGAAVILKEFSGQKLMIKLTKENWEEKNKALKDINFDLTNETATIAGYNCKKAIAKMADGKTFVVYYSPDIVAANKDYDPTFAKLPGLAMQYEIESGKMKFKYTISKVSLDPVPIAKFDFPTAGYRVMTYEENQQLKKGN